MLGYTFFDVLAHILASADNFPFCTDESRVPMPDERLGFLCQNHKAARKIPAFLSAVHIAGLGKGHTVSQVWDMSAYLAGVPVTDSFT